MYKMWYSGGDGPNNEAIGYATSPDGITWTKYAGNPVLTKGPADWEARAMGYPVVFRKEAGGYQMFYWGAPEDLASINTGYAVSDDGINWTKADSENPVFAVGPPGSWDDFVIAASSILRINKKYHLWYTGELDAVDPFWTAQIGWATSDDGIH